MVLLAMLQFAIAAPIPAAVALDLPAAGACVSDGAVTCSGTETTIPVVESALLAAPAPQPTVVVRDGDTLSGLAAAWGVTLEVAEAANAALVPDPDLIQPGTVLTMPGGVQPPPAPSQALTQAVARVAVSASPVVASVGNRFVFGFCTWYVANRRPVPWLGDAGQWPAAAAAMGFAEGPTPRPGAIMVTAEGPIGHVAYVEAVYPDGSWRVSEMNFTFWDVVSSRTIRPGTIPLRTFIY